MEALANLDGKILPLGEAKVSALDRGFLFGDAVYEVLRLYGGRPWLRAEHFARLARSLAEIRIRGVDLGRLERRMEETIAAGGFQDAIVYIQITRGAARRSLLFPGGVEPLEFLFVEEFPDTLEAARRDGVAVVSYPDIRWDRCDIKSTNLLANVLAMQTAHEAGGAEALLVLPDGTLTEGTHTSFFGVLGDAVLTAPNSHAILPGITRGLTLRLAARAGIPVREEVVRRADLGRVSELFLTGTRSEVLPIVRVDDRPIGNGRPGAVTQRLQAAYAEAVLEFLSEG
jgi:D-alanine transaminase